MYPASKKRFTDRQVAAMIPKYFDRDHNSPNIKRIRIYGKDEQKYLHLEIDVNRNRYLGELDYTLSAMANITQYAKYPFDVFIVVMQPVVRSEEPEALRSNAKCTIDYFIHKRITNNEPVLVHCLAGMGRTGVILACYLIKYQKMSASEATEKIREERPGSIQSYPQEEIIFRFEKSLKR